MNNIEYIENFFKESKQILDNIDKNDVEKFITILFDAWKNDSQIFIFGNGGSASTATHFAADLSKTAIVKGKKRFKGISLFDNVPLVSAWINDEGWENVYLGQLQNFFQKGDIAMAISVHGGSGEGNAGEWSQNLLKGLQYAKDNGGKALGMSGFDGGAMKKMADCCIVVPFDATPHVEAFHVVLHHMIVFRLKQMIKDE
ncbi:SIS domain-containing protein [Candidatus Woesearchaeota archaeon]|nr:SIS domain-containing protein [Candidatus Woesearchaeota archaeon]